LDYKPTVGASKLALVVGEIIHSG